MRVQVVAREEKVSMVVIRERICGGVKWRKPIREAQIGQELMKNDFIN